MSDTRKPITASGMMLIAAVIAAAVGIMVLLGLAPVNQEGGLTPQCSAAFENVVACGSRGEAIGFAIAGAFISGVLAYVVVRRVNRN